MNKLQLIDADTLYYKPLAHPKMLIDGVLSDGLAILAGDSKIGKSWMVLWLCLQISRGEAVWGLPQKNRCGISGLLAHRRFRDTVSQLLAAVGNTELKPNLASKQLTRHYSDVLLPLGITYEYRKTAAARLVLLELHDGADGHDGSSGSERLASLRKQNDGTFRLPQASLQASSASWEEAEGDEELPL